MPFNLLSPIPVSSAVKAEQIRQLYQLGTTVQLLGMISALVAVTMLWQVIDQAFLLGWIAAAGLQVRGRIDTRPKHPKARDRSDPLHAARAAEVTSLWRLGLGDQ